MVTMSGNIGVWPMVCCRPAFKTWRQPGPCLYNSGGSTIVTDSRSGREGPVPTLKLKNNLLAAVLVLTVMPPAIDLGRLAIEHCCSLVSEKLGESGDVRTTDE